MTFDNCLRDGSQHGSREYIVGANWGSSRLRIYLIDRALNVVDEDGSRLSRFPLNFGSGRCDRQAAITGSS